MHFPLISNSENMIHSETLDQKCYVRVKPKPEDRKEKAFLTLRNDIKTA